jgi:TonB family protein
MGEDSSRPQKLTRKGFGKEAAAAFMGGTLYDAPPMQTQVIPLFALLGAATVAAAQGAPPPTPSPVVSAPRFSGSDEIPLSNGHGDAYSLDEIKIGGAVLTEDQQVARWQAELNAGRARAGVLAGAYRTYRALTPTDCSFARTTLIRADELGADQAPWVLSKLAATDSCGQIDRAQRELWLKKAVTLDDPRALLELINLYRESPEAADRVPQYLYGLVAAGYWDATKSAGAREGFDAMALEELAKALSADDRSRAEAESARILQQMLKRRERFTPPKPVEFARGDAKNKASYVAWQADYRHECQWNLKNNCTGVQRLIFVDLTNKHTDFQSCSIELRARDFVSGVIATEPFARRVLIGPQATRRLLLGDNYDMPDKKIVTARCTPLPRLLDNSAAGRCRAKLLGSIDVQSFYPDSARRQGIEGSTVVRFWIPPGSSEATDAEVATSSGNADLDNAAVATVQSGKFTFECDYALSSIRIAFKLAN